MDLLLCEPGNGVWLAERSVKKFERLPCPFDWPCVPCVSPACCAVCCLKERECLCLERRTMTEVCRMPCVPGVCDMLFSRCGRYLFQLSSEADSIHTRCVATGELLYAAPAGVFPHCIRLNRSGREILCAGGAVGEAYLFNAPDLMLNRTVFTRHPCFLADFWKKGMVLVCAEEGEDIRTVVYTLSPGGVKPRLLTEMPGQPGGMCVCPDGTTVLLSTRAGLFKMELTTGKLLWNCPEWALCRRIECSGNDAMISDTLDGTVYVFNHQKPWERSLIVQHADAQACFLHSSV